MPQTETVESLLSPSLRVSRPVAACSRCRGAKIKCDGKLPACTACEKAGKPLDCSGANDDFARGKERSYVAALEGAYERLQKQIAELKTGEAPMPLSASNVDSGNAHSRNIKAGGRSVRKEALDVDDLVGDFGFLSVNATSRDFNGFTGTMSWARLLLTMAVNKPLPPSYSHQLPPRHAATALVQQYLDTIYVISPFLLEPDLMASLNAVYQDPGRYAKASDHWVVRMVLAIALGSAARSKNDPRQQHALNHISAALEFAEEVLHPGSIAGLQAILLLTQYAMIDAEYFRSWQLLGIGSRVLVDLGLHQEPPPEAKISKDRLDVRRRVFHSLYCMDRQISMSHKHAFSFTDDSTAVEPPRASSSATANIDGQSFYGPPPELFLRSIHPALHLFEIRKIQSNAYQQVNESSRQPITDLPTADAFVWTVLSKAENWWSRTPQMFSGPHRLLFRLELLYTKLFILSPSIRIPLIPDLHKALIFEYSVDFAKLMCSAIQPGCHHPFLSCADFRRMNQVGKNFLTVLWEDYDKILWGQIGPPSPISYDPSGPQPPVYEPSADVVANIHKALDFFNLTFAVLEYARQRWDKGHLRDRFEQEAAVLMERLRHDFNIHNGTGTNQLKQGSVSVPAQPRSSRSGSTSTTALEAGDYQQQQPRSRSGYPAHAPGDTHGQHSYLPEQPQYSQADRSSVGRLQGNKPPPSQTSSRRCSKK